MGLWPITTLYNTNLLGGCCGTLLSPSRFPGGSPLQFNWMPTQTSNNWDVFQQPHHIYLSIFFAILKIQEGLGTSLHSQRFPRASNFLDLTELLALRVKVRPPTQGWTAKPPRREVQRCLRLMVMAFSNSHQGIPETANSSVQMYNIEPIRNTHIYI